MTLAVAPNRAARRRAQRERITGTIGSDLPALAPGESGRFAWVDDETVEPSHRAMVREHVDRAAALLGLGDIAIRFYTGADDEADFTLPAGPDGGFVLGVTPPLPPGVLGVGIPASLRAPELVAAVAAHEVRHCAHMAERHRLSARYDEIHRLAKQLEAEGNAVIARHELLGDEEWVEQDCDRFVRLYMARLGDGR